MPDIRGSRGVVVPRNCVWEDRGLLRSWLWVLDESGEAVWWVGVARGFGFAACDIVCRENEVRMCDNFVNRSEFDF